MKWDYFISHASEDKLAIASPLAKYLKEAKFGVWYDDFSLKVGDSLLSSIDRGLSKSRFGITILSPAFFAKKWPKQELAGLAAIEGERKRILPIWHNITSNVVSQHSPILADRKAIDSKKGLQAVAEAIVSASFPKRLKNLPLNPDFSGGFDQWQDAKNGFRTLLERETSVEDLRMFLSVNHILLFQFAEHNPVLVPGFRLPPALTCDFAILAAHGVTGPIEIIFVILGPLSRENLDPLRIRIEKEIGPRVTFKRRPYNYHGGTCFGEFPSLLPTGDAIRKFTQAENVHFESVDWWLMKFLIICGRRSPGGIPQQAAFPEALGVEVELVSYDRLVDDQRPRSLF